MHGGRKKGLRGVFRPSRAGRVGFKTAHFPSYVTFRCSGVSVLRGTRNVCETPANSPRAPLRSARARVSKENMYIRMHVALRGPRHRFTTPPGAAGGRATAQSAAGASSISAAPASCHTTFAAPPSGGTFCVCVRSRREPCFFVAFARALVNIETRRGFGAGAGASVSAPAKQQRPFFRLYLTHLHVVNINPATMNTAKASMYILEEVIVRRTHCRRNANKRGRDVSMYQQGRRRQQLLSQMARSPNNVTSVSTPSLRHKKSRLACVRPLVRGSRGRPRRYCGA